MLVEEIMTPNPERADVRDSIRDVLYKLIELDVRHLPIVENDELIGMVSDRDLRALTAPTEAEAEGMNLRDVQYDAPVSTLMQGDVISVTSDTDVTEVIDLMLDHKVGALPVVDGITGTLVGIVSYIDVLREARELF
jgi:CBS domain-containing protein